MPDVNDWEPRLDFTPPARVKQQYLALNVSREDWDSLKELWSATGAGGFDLNLRRRSITMSSTRVTLLMIGGRLSGLALARLRGSSGSLDVRIRGTQATVLGSPIPLDPIVASLSSQVRSRAEQVLRHGGVLTERASADIRDALIALSPALESILEQLETTRLSAEDGSTARQTQHEGRDGLALAAEIAGLDSATVISHVGTNSDQNTPFLVNLANANTTEASIIRTDLRGFGDWEFEESDVHDVVHFVDPDDRRRRMTVVYADKESLEFTTGTDLIYYRADEPAFILVQYKRMKLSRGAPSDQKWGWSFQPDNEQLLTEIERMRAIGKSEPGTSIPGWRLSGEPFYFKLVQDGKMRLREENLSRGMYLPLDLFERILQDPPLGPNGGVRLGWHNVKRYLSTSQFVDLARNGFIGSREIQRTS